MSTDDYLHLTVYSIGHFFLLWPEDRDIASSYLIKTNPNLSVTISNILMKYCDKSSHKIKYEFE